MGEAQGGSHMASVLEAPGFPSLHLPQDFLTRRRTEEPEPQLPSSPSAPLEGANEQ